MKIRIGDKVSIVIEDGGPSGSATIIQGKPKSKAHDYCLVRFDDTSLGWEIEDNDGFDKSTTKKFRGEGGFYWVKRHEIRPWLGPEDVVDVD